jgi:hypothetical protein
MMIVWDEEIHYDIVSCDIFLLYISMQTPVVDDVLQPAGKRHVFMQLAP